MALTLPEGCTVVKGDVDTLPTAVKDFVLEKAALCTPAHLFICDGSKEEFKALVQQVIKEGIAVPLKKHENCYLVRTDPRDVARVESKTFICTENKDDAIPEAKEGVQGKLGNWKSIAEMEQIIAERFPGCMKGRTMYVMPFSMGPVGSPVSKIGIELTDSAYVVLCMSIMTRMGSHVLKALGDGPFVRCLHSVGDPLPRANPTHKWPCNPEKTFISHFPSRREIISFGSGYGGNSLLGKKCFALRIAMNIARDEGWLAEHMLITGITNPQGEKKYFVAAFPSACGKTNLAMIQPTLPGWKVECVGDDIAWMWFDETGQLRAINPESGFFGVAPGTNRTTNPVAVKTFQKDTIFTNTAETSEGDFWWEGRTSLPPPGVTITTWLGEPNWDPNGGTRAAHPNSRFTARADHCPIMDKDWENPAGVPISGILFGGRRPEGVPLVFEAFNWQHGVFVASSLSSQATAAAEHKGKVIMHDPFAMRPFFGYNFGKYLEHWLGFSKKPNLKLPKIFHVNWFRINEKGEFLWPGYCENIRVLDWIFRRCNNEDIADPSPVGYLPKVDSINLEGLNNVDLSVMKELLHLPKDYWLGEVEEMRKYFGDQVGRFLPKAIQDELDALHERVKAM